MNASAGTRIGPPLGLLAELTHRCPLSCPYCSNPVELSRRSQELDETVWQDLLRQAARLGVLQVHFSGGEPLLRRDLESLVATAEAAGLYSNLITSGVGLERARVEALAKVGLSHVQISVQDARSGPAEWIGGFKGAQARKVEAARAVREAGLSLTVNAVVHRQNLDRLEEIVALAEDWGASRLEVAHVQYYGWALKNRASLMPTRRQLETATRVVEAARARLSGRLAIDYVVPDYYARYPKPCMGGWARQFLVVAPDGRVLPCHAAASIPELSFERVGERGLAEIWQDSPAFQRFRGTDWMPEPCRSCARQEVDWGGCRCQAYAILGEAAATDPACELSPHHDRLARLAEEDSTSGAEWSYRRFTPSRSRP